MDQPEETASIRRPPVDLAGESPGTSNDAISPIGNTTLFPRYTPRESGDNDDGETSSSSSSESEYEEYEQCDCVDDQEIRPDRIPYSAIYDAQEEVHKRGYFNPSVPVRARIVSVNRDTSGTIHLINPYVYTIELQHGQYTWTIFRRYIDFQLLHNRLLLFRAAAKVAAPMRRLETTLAYDNDKDLVEGGVSIDCVTESGLSESIRMQTLYHTASGRSPEERRISTTPRDNKALALRQQTKDAPVGRAAPACQHDHRARKRRPCKLPRFPMLPDSVISQERVEERKQELERYLSAVLHIYAYRNHHETAEFLEISRLSFIHNLGAKMKEGFVKKRPGGMRQFHGIKRYCIANCAKWSMRWLVVKDSFVAYLHPRTEEVRHVMLFDADFNVRAGAKETEGIKRGLLISNMQRDLMLKCSNEEEAVLWKHAIQEAIGGVGKPWLDTHRYHSSYPPREHAYAQWFVDGGPYMDHVASMLELAKEEIFITGWWLSPEIYLKRPMTEGDRWRLDEVLKRKAEQGVRVFVLLYKEVTMALGISSYYSKKQLMDKHPNIKVMRHPDHLPGTGVLLWAHHEKVIVIDQNIAFVGGIDLCYGRWDDHRHRLVDLGSVQYQAEHLLHLQPKNLASGMKSVTQMFGTLTAMDVEVPIAADETNRNGLSYEGPRGSVVITVGGIDEADVSTSAEGKQTEKEKSTRRIARMRSKTFSKAVPATVIVSTKQRVSDGGGSTGSKRMDLAEIVKKYRQAVESGVIQAEKSRAGTPPVRRKRNKVAKYVHGWKEAYARRKREQLDEPVFAAEYETAWRKLQEESQIDLGLSGGGKFWIGKDYVNFIYKDFTDLDMPFHDFIDRAVTPRMPWHDIGAVVYGSAARDVARHFIQRWNSCKMEKVKDDKGFPFLMPKSYENVRVPRVFRHISTPCNVQVLRSASLWSVGMNAMEASIHQAYLHMIREAKHFIYIENQFFVSQIGGGEVHNKIAQALFDRIVRAHKNNEQFRVYVLMPLLPGFEGQLGTTGASALQVVLHWTFVSISKGPFCLLHNLEREVGDPSRYITFCSLRTHGELVGRLVTELLYIHSKVIIVDDRCCLIGSANINDRSQLGKRDSEVALYIEDVEFEPSTVNGQPYTAGKFSGRLRRQLFREHLGLLDSDHPSDPIDIQDAGSEEFFTRWKEIAAANEGIYERVFACIPCDHVQTFEELTRYQQQIPLSEYNHAAAVDLLKKLRGRVVAFPTKFLLHGNLTPSIASKEGLAPAYLFT